MAKNTSKSPPDYLAEISVGISTSVIIVAIAVAAFCYLSKKNICKENILFSANISQETTVSTLTSNIQFHVEEYRLQELSSRRGSEFDRVSNYCSNLTEIEEVNVNYAIKTNTSCNKPNDNEAREMIQKRNKKTSSNASFNIQEHERFGKTDDKQEENEIQNKDELNNLLDRLKKAKDSNFNGEETDFRENVQNKKTTYSTYQTNSQFIMVSKNLFYD